MRSVRKGPYIDHSLLDKVKDQIANKKSIVIKTKSRRSTIIADFVGLQFDVYNGKRYHLVVVNQNMIGRKFGEFSPTRTFVQHSGLKANLKKGVKNVKSTKGKK